MTAVRASVGRQARGGVVAFVDDALAAVLSGRVDALTALVAQLTPWQSGHATLVDGTVTVAAPGLAASDIIWLGYRTLLGTPGAVYVSAKVMDTSFDITSTNAADGSTIQYEIFHPLPE